MTSSKATSRESEGIGTPDEDGYIHRISLLGALEDKQRTLNQRTLINSLVYIAKLAPGLPDIKYVGEYYETRLKELRKRHHGEEVTGFLLIYPSYAVHMVEASARLIYSLLKSLTTFEHSAVLTGCKIINISHNIANRITQNWSYRILTINPSAESYNPSKDTVQSLTLEFLTTLINLVHFIVVNPKLNVKNAVENLQDVIPDLLIPQPLISYLQRQEEILSSSEFLKYATTFSGYVQDIETVWPMPVNVLNTL